MSCRTVREKDVTKFHVQLCVALLFMYFIYLIGIERTEIEEVCTAFSFFLQYSVLASVFWMGAEAVLMIKVFIIDVFERASAKFIVIVSFICWGKLNMFIEREKITLCIMSYAYM